MPTVETSHTLYQDVGDGLEAVCWVWRQPDRCNTDDVCVVNGQLVKFFLDEFNANFGEGSDE